MNKPIADAIQVLLISGSVRRPSHTSTLTDSVRQALSQLGVATTQWNLGEAPLPIADPLFHSNPSQHSSEAVRAFVAAADACDALVLASPIYHNSYSGVLKNGLDHLAIPHFRYKPVGLIGHGGNRSTQAVDHLRIVVRGLSGVAIPTQVCTSAQDYAEIAGQEYEVEAEDILQRIEHFALELTMFARQLRLIRQAMRINCVTSGARNSSE